MDAFDVHRQLIDDYSSFTGGFVDIRDDRMRQVVEPQNAAGVQWPDPGLSLDPSHQGIARHQHQRDAVEVARALSGR